MSSDPPERSAKRFVHALPPNPNLDKQRKLAKALARNYWRGFPEAFARVRALHPNPPAPESFALSDAPGVAMMREPRRSWRSIRGSSSVRPGRLLRQVAGAARNNNVATVRAMLRRGLPVAALSQHGAMPLHSAAFHGNP